MTTLQNVKPTGATGLALLGKGNSKELELEASDAATRDVWVRQTDRQTHTNTTREVF